MVDLLRLSLEQDCERYVKYHFALTHWQIIKSGIAQEEAKKIIYGMDTISRSLPERLYFSITQDLDMSHYAPSARLRREFQQDFYLAKRDLLYTYYDIKKKEISLHDDVISSYLVLEMGLHQLESFVKEHSHLIQEEIAREENPLRACILQIFDGVVQTDANYLFSAQQRFLLQH